MTDQAPPAAVIGIFYNARGNATTARLDFKFSFQTWWDWWQIDDNWLRRGHHKGGAMMMRYDSKGPFSAENCYCGSHGEKRSKPT